jgi:hypothetical protein
MGRLQRVLPILGALGLIGLATLRPMPVSSHPGAVETLGAADRVANILLFLPLGITLQWAKIRWRRATALGFALSVSIELVQMLIPGRFPNPLDVLTNTIGSALGTQIPRLLSAHATARNAGLAWGAAVAMLGGLAILAQPSAPPGPYTVARIPPNSAGHTYDGDLLEATLGGEVVEAAALHGLSNGAPLQITLRLGRGLSEPRPLLEIRGAHRRHLALISAGGPDLIWRVGDLGNRLGFASTAHRWPDLWFGRAAGQLTTLRLSVEREGVCVRAGHTARCGQGQTPSRGWARVHALQQPPPWFNALLDALWTLGWGLILGWWAPSRRWTVGATALLIGLVAQLTAVTALAIPAAWLSLVLVAGATLGRALAAWRTRVASE